MIYIILLLAFVLRLIAINQSLWLDEAISGLAVKNYSFFELVTKFSLGDTHPPLYYLILRFWTLFFNFSEVSLRIPSVIFGVATVYLTYKIAKIFGGKASGIFSALFTATAPLHIYYSQEARMYAMSTFLVCLVVFLFLKKKWVFLSLSILLLGLTDYLPLLILFPIWIYALYTKRDKKFLVKLAKAHIPLFLFLVSWIPFFLKQSTSTSAYLLANNWWQTVLGNASLKELILVWVKFIIGRISFENNLLYSGVVFLVSVPFAYALFKAASFRRETLLLWLWLVLPVSASFVGAFFIPGFSYFRLLYILPAFYILLAFGVSKISVSDVLVAGITLLNLSFSFAYLFNSSFWREDWRGLVLFIESRIQSDEVVLISYPEAFASYKWYSKNPHLVKSFNSYEFKGLKSLYTLDYLMDLTDPQRNNYKRLSKEGFENLGVYNFRGVGQVRYWQRL